MITPAHSTPITKVIPPHRGTGLHGRVRVPGDKSISHRSLMLGALAQGITEVTGLLHSEDVQSTERCLKDLGVFIERTGGKKEETVFIHGVSEQGLTIPTHPLDCGNSGTTMRLMMGILSSFPFSETGVIELTGDASLTKRPMKRVATPLALMGAQIEMRRDNYAPLKVIRSNHNTPLKGVEYILPIASAQIKSAILLAALFAKGDTLLRGEIHSRDHTERMLQYFGAQMHQDKDHILISGGQKLFSRKIEVPGDPSTAAFWMAAAAMVKDSELELTHVGLNPTRTGFIEVIQRMGAKLHIHVDRQLPEPMGRVQVTWSPGLKGTTVSPQEIPTLIDELPILAILATQARGETEVRGAEELRVKETDRIEALAVNFRSLGLEMETFPDGFRIRGPQTVRGGKVESFYDHRMAMAFSIAALVADDDIHIQGANSASVSYPEFFETLSELQKST